MRLINCTHLIEAADKPLVSRRQIQIDQDKISAVRDIAAAARDSEQLFVLPALVNAHDHGRAVRTSSVNASGKPLKSWIQYQALIPSVDPYLAAVVTLSRSALGGVGVVMMHLTKPQGLTDLPTEAAAIARAARDVGVRVGFAIAIRERNPLDLCSVRAGSLNAARSSARPDRRPAAQAAVAQGVHCAGRRSCGRRGWADVRCPVRTQRRAMVQRRAALGDRGGVPAHRPQNPHASSGDALSASVGGRDPSRKASSNISTALACFRLGSRSPIASGPGRMSWNCWRNGASQSP